MPKSIKVEDIQPGDQVLRYGMWFNVEKVEKLPADRGGHVHQLSLKPAPNRIPAGAACTLTLFPGELITKEDRQIATS
jgi:hypothetical protein